MSVGKPGGDEMTVTSTLSVGGQTVTTVQVRSTKKRRVHQIAGWSATAAQAGVSGVPSKLEKTPARSRSLLCPHLPVSHLPTRPTPGPPPPRTHLQVYRRSGKDRSQLLQESRARNTSLQDVLAKQKQQYGDRA